MLFVFIFSFCQYFLSFDHVSQSSDGGSDGGGGSGGDSVSTTGNSLLTRSTRPDTSGTSLDGLLTTESTVVSRVLLDFQLLDLSSQRRTITNTVLTGNTNLLCSLSPVKINYNPFRKKTSIFFFFVLTPQILFCLSSYNHYPTTLTDTT